jgi:hypothetical protein
MGKKKKEPASKRVTCRKCGETFKGPDALCVLCAREMRAWLAATCGEKLWRLEASMRERGQVQASS